MFLLQHYQLKKYINMLTCKKLLSAAFLFNNLHKLKCPQNFYLARRLSLIEVLL